jgi:hypothetical protein
MAVSTFLVVLQAEAYLILFTKSLVKSELKPLKLQCRDVLWTSSIKYDDKSPLAALWPCSRSFAPGVWPSGSFASAFSVPS